ncbi:MAG: ISAs1 family transposase [Thermanaerothrix sp.]|uniref:ISAs1 family transposase n=1 Tax=Thermanaerothrix solaris TaxID=3058434 RepID=A0ABU3NP92_9CHLR|nr:ISAs1 family transposase [Thermanaerothrix sp. 4228-RoL]MDT8898651.1 ISAs1 family transposase [Thermanaerothrix sp. 4228-RoL]
MEYSTLRPWQEINENGVIYDASSLYAYFQRISDPRKARGKRYHLTTLLALIFLGKLSGKDTPVEIADWASNHAEALARHLKLKRTRMPHHNTIRRVFQNILDEAEFDRLMRDYQRQAVKGGEQLAMDGKTLRGTRLAAEELADQVLSVYDVDEQCVMAQIAVDRKENEIVAAPRALEQVAIAGKIITGDAMHAQRALSAQIVARGGDYLWVVKENQERLYRDIERLFAPDKPKPGFGRTTTDFLQAETVNKGHGRIEKRQIQTSTMLNDYLDWPGLKQVYRMERHFTWIRQGKAIKTSREVEYGITSLSREKALPKRLLQVRRKHWQIETGLHYRRDVTFREDATRMTKGAAGRILATIHNLVLALIKRAGFHNAAQARRWFDGHLDQAFALLVSGDSRL